MNLAQIREPAIAFGLLTSGEFDRMLALLDDPEFAITAPVLFTAWAADRETWEGNRLVADPVPSADRGVDPTSMAPQA